MRLKYANPLAIDDAGTDFPDLSTVIAHPSFPWQDEALAVVTPDRWLADLTSSTSSRKCVP